ncbi:MAG: glycosyltransferase [Porticoccaceae bacterium]
MTRRLTVVQLLPALDAGGVERGTLEIAAALVAAGHRAIVVSAGGRLLPALLASGAEHVELAIGRKSLFSLRHVWRLRQLIASADIVHARSRLPAWLGWLAWRGLHGPRPRFLTTVHGLNSVNAYSAIMTRGERVIAVSRTVREHLIRHYPTLDPDRIRVIPRGIDAAHFVHGYWASAAWRRAFIAEYPALAAAPWLCLPGRGTRLKGHADALRLLAALHAAGNDCCLLLLGADQAGREAYLRELRGEAERLGVAGKLVMTPPRQDVREVLAESALVLQLSRQPEAFGRTVVEALALGVPVLGWAQGGVGELLADLYPEGAVALGDHDTLLAQARRLLAERPRPAAFNHYRVQTMQEATLAVYAELAEATP